SDSRLAHPGSLFVALTGGHHDGHDFVAHACRRGAVAALCQPGRARPSPGLAILEAEDQLAMLGLIAHAVRRRSRARVVGIAGAGRATRPESTPPARPAPHSRPPPRPRGPTTPAGGPPSPGPAPGGSPCRRSGGGGRGRGGPPPGWGGPPSGRSESSPVSAPTP